MPCHCTRIQMPRNLLIRTVRVFPGTRLPLHSLPLPDTGPDSPGHFQGLNAMDSADCLWRKKSVEPPGYFPGCDFSGTARFTRVVSPGPVPALVSGNRALSRYPGYENRMIRWRRTVPRFSSRGIIRNSRWGWRGPPVGGGNGIPTTPLREDLPVHYVALSSPPKPVRRLV